jgi:hypothetical protein
MYGLERMSSEFQEHFGLLTKELSNEDDLGAIVRGHIVVEATLNELLEKLVFWEEYLPSLRFEQKIKLCAALGMDPELIEPLKELGNMRNTFSHKIKIRLSMKMVQKFYVTFNENDKEIINSNICLVSGVGRKDEAKLLSNMHPKQLFIFVLVVLWVRLSFNKKRALINRKNKSKEEIISASAKR